MRDRPDRSIDGFDDHAARSTTLPATMYFDPQVYTEEQEKIFQNSWQFVAHGAEVVSPGQYVTAEIAGQRIFVIRGDDGELGGYFNVCLHRGHSLLSGSGTVGKMITCPYHAWAYNRSGQLKGARMSERMDGFDYSDFELPDLAVEEFCGLVFVNLSIHARPMEEVYPGLADAIRQICPEPANLRVASQETFEIAGNWKNVTDNLLECYHCHPAHRAFVDLIDMDNYSQITHQNWSISSGPVNPDSNVYAVTEGAQDFASIYVWPNLSIGRIPGQAGILLFRIAPTAPEHTTQILTFLSPGGDPTETEKNAFEYFNTVLGPEDVNLIEDVQRGLHSLGYHQGRMICIPDRPEISEHGVHHFQSMVRAALAGD